MSPVFSCAEDYQLSFTSAGNVVSPKGNAVGTCTPMGPLIIRLEPPNVTVLVQGQRCVTQLQDDGTFTCKHQQLNLPLITWTGKFSGANVDGMLTVKGFRMCAAIFHGQVQTKSTSD